MHTGDNNNTNGTYFHTFTKLSHPPVTNLLTKPPDFDPGYKKKKKKNISKLFLIITVEPAITSSFVGNAHKQGKKGQQTCCVVL